MTSTALARVDALKQSVEPMAPELQAVCYKMVTPERIWFTTSDEAYEPSHVYGMATA